MDPDFKNPTDYSLYKLKEYSKIIMEGEALSDLNDVKRLGIHSSSPMALYCWRVFTKWFNENPGDGYTQRDISIKLKHEFTLDPLLFHLIPDLKSSHIHMTNQYRFIGLLFLDPYALIHVYRFETTIIIKGLDWFRIGNSRMKGNFQQEELLIPELVKL
jgi:hypothetical protein